MLSSSTASGGTFYVATGGDDGANGSSETPFATIAVGVSAATASSAPRIVVVRSGEYRIDSAIEISAAVTVRSETGNRADVIIDGQGKTPLVKWTSANPKATLSGLTLANGYTTSADEGAGVFMYGGTITNCVVRNCLKNGGGGSHAYGAGIYARYAPNIVDTIVCGNIVSNANPASENYYSRGGGIYIFDSTGGSVRGCTVENNIAWVSRGTSNQNNPNANLCRGGGICVNDSTSFEIVDCIIRGNCATNASANGKAGRGGGLYVNSGTTVSNCLVYGNMASAQGGGVYANGSSLSHCTITNNAINAVTSAGFELRGAGVFLDGSNPQCLNSIIAGNKLQGASKVYASQAEICGGGGIGITSSSAFVANCIVSNNTAHAGGAFLVYGGGGMISNCLVCANSGSLGGGAMVYWKPQGMMMADCIIVDNTAGGDGGAVCFGKSAGADCGGLAFRNCFIGRNSLTDGEGLFNSAVAAAYSQPLTIEYCTLAANTSYRFVVSTSTSAKSAVSNVFCRGNVIFDTRRRDDSSVTVASVFGPDGAGDVSAATTNAWCNFTESGLAGFSTDPQYGNFGIITSASFVDAGSGDYRLVGGSGVKDKGGPIQPWMGNGGKKGPFDMGDGTMTVVYDGGYGIDIVRNNALPRLGGLPEPGCFELWVPSGFTLIFR